jgi:hypothetical protein
VRFYNRSLTQNEARELRHLSYAGGDANCVAYYKFNESNGLAYDRIGSVHIALAGTATRNAGTVAVESGQSVRQTVSTSGVKDFAPTGLSLTFPNAAPYPNGELCVSRLDGLPDSLPTNFEAIGGRYWVVNNHGTAIFNALTAMTFSGINVNSTVASRYKLYKRTSNEHLNNWTLVDAADAVVTGANGSITFNIALNVTSFSQFVIVEKGVRISPKIILQGAYNTATGLMNDQLRVANLIPTTEPYTALNFGQIEGGGESIKPAVLAITGTNAIVDWVFIELRDKNNPATKLFTRAALLQADGDVVDVDGVSAVHFANAVNESYYVVVRHRNHLGAMTASAIALTETANTLNFTNNALATWGTNAQKEVNTGVFGLWNGDLDVTGTITASDRSLAWNNRNLLGYYIFDANMNGVCDASDRSVVWNNRNLVGQVP